MSTKTTTKKPAAKASATQEKEKVQTLTLDEAVAAINKLPDGEAKRQAVAHAEAIYGENSVSSRLIGAKSSEPGAPAVENKTPDEKAREKTEDAQSVSETGKASTADESENAARFAGTPLDFHDDGDDSGDDDEGFVKSGFAKIQLRNFTGSYRDAHFDANGVCERVSRETLEKLHAQFPGIELVSAEAIK